MVVCCSAADFIFICFGLYSCSRFTNIWTFNNPDPHPPTQTAAEPLPRAEGHKASVCCLSQPHIPLCTSLRDVSLKRLFSERRLSDAQSSALNSPNPSSELWFVSSNDLRLMFLFLDESESKNTKTVSSQTSIIWPILTPGQLHLLLLLLGCFLNQTSDLSPSWTVFSCKPPGFSSTQRWRWK